MVALLSVDADRVVTLLFGAGYAPAGNILRWQLIAFAILPLLDLCFTALAADGPPAYPAWLLAALIAPAVGLCLAPRRQPWRRRCSGPGDRRGDRNWPRSFGHVAAVSDAPAPLTLRVGGATALTALISASISVAGPWLVAKLAALFAVWILLLLVLLRELTLADLKALAIWKRSAA